MESHCIIVGFLWRSWRVLTSWNLEELKNLTKLRAIYVMSFDDQTCVIKWIA